MKLGVSLALTTAVIAVPSGTPVFADPDSGGDSTGFWLEDVDEANTANNQVSTSDGSADTSRSDINEAFIGSSACVAADVLQGEFYSVGYCAPEEPGLLTLGAVRSAFARLDLPAGELVIQPPDGLTLVNFDTNFYTTSTAPLTRTVTLLGRQVTIEATPTIYTWDFGDGETLATSDPGAAYPDLRVTHDYRLTGTYRPSLSTTYAGRFRVGDGPWREIPGTVTIDGVGQRLRAIEARPTLVGYDGPS